MYQYNTKFKPPNPLFQTSKKPYVLHPPNSTAPPYACETFNDFRRDLNQEFFRCQGYVDKRLSYPLIGVAGYCYQTTSGQKRAVALQLSACGDVLYQSFVLQDPSVSWKKNNIVTNLSSGSSESANARQIAARHVRLKWALKVSDLYRESVEKENPLNLRCTRTTLNAMPFSASGVIKKYAKASKNLSNSCEMCTKICWNDNVARMSDNSTSEEISRNRTRRNSSKKEKCSLCGVEKKLVKNLFFRPRNRLYRANLVESQTDNFWCSNDSAHSETEIPPLKLMNPSVSQSSLGRVLLETWNTSYEEMWGSMEEKNASEKSKKKEEKFRERFDLSSDDDIPSQPHQSLPSKSPEPAYFEVKCEKVESPSAPPQNSTFCVKTSFIVERNPEIKSENSKTSQNSHNSTQVASHSKTKLTNNELSNLSKTTLPSTTHSAKSKNSLDNLESNVQPELRRRKSLKRRRTGFF